MECKTLEGVDSLVHISRGVLIELSFRWISSCLAWCPLIREIAGIWVRWSSTISLRFYCALLVHFALQWLPMMASPIAPLIFNITSDMTSSQATTEMYQVPPDSKWGDCRHQGLCFPIPSYSFSPLSPSHDSKWGDFRRSRALLSHSKLICAYSAVARCQDSGVPLYHESNLTGVASPDRATRQCVTLIYTSNDFRCALSVFQEPLYGLPLSAHIWQLSTDATWPYSCGAITFEC